MELGKALGQRIRQLREERGLTQEQLAYTCQAISSKGYLSDIESGKRLPSLRALADIAHRLEVDEFALLVFPERSLLHNRVDRMLRGDEAEEGG